MKKYIALMFALALGACATAPVVTPVSGNGTCHPSQDLPNHKQMTKVPENDTLLEDLWALLLAERKQHAEDIRDYNSLYDQCVDKGPAANAPAK